MLGAASPHYVASAMQMHRQHLDGASASSVCGRLRPTSRAVRLLYGVLNCMARRTPHAHSVHVYEVKDALAPASHIAAMLMPLLSSSWLAV